MSVVVPIDAEKITEFLFENSESVSSEIYLRIMNLMKQYHDHKNNRDEIIEYIDTLENRQLKSKIKKYIKDPVQVSFFQHNIFRFWCIVLILIFFGILAGFAYVITTH
jgi:hypothetical protein